MKHDMKKELSIMIVILCVILTACDPGSYYYDYEILSLDVVSVELIHYDNGIPKYHNEFLIKSRNGIAPFFSDSAEIIETLDSKDMDGFFQDLSQIHILEFWNHSNSAIGTCIRITYSSGDFEIVSVYKDDDMHNQFIGRFDSEGKPLRFIGGFADSACFTDLIDQYFQYTID